MELFPHQFSNAVKLVKAIRLLGGGVDLSATGTGKSLTALTVAQVLRKDPYIICPASLRHDWVARCADLGITDYVIQSYESRRRSTKPFGLDGDIIIYDEAHWLKSPDSLQSKLVTQHRFVDMPTLMLTATPLNSPLHTRALFHALGVCDFECWHHYVQKHFKGVYKSKVLRGHPLMWQRNEDDLLKIRELIGRQSVRTSWSEVDTFPDLTFEAIQAPTSLTERELLDALWSVAEPDISTYTKERMEMEMLRVPFMIERAKDCIEHGSSVVAFFNHTEPLGAFAEAHLCQALHGSTPAKTRAKAIRNFQESTEPTVLAVNAAVGGAGLDLHDLNGIPRTSLISPPSSAFQLKQMIGRTHRAGALSPARVQLIYLEETEEARRIVPALMEKKHNIELITDTDLNPN